MFDIIKKEIESKDKIIDDLVTALKKVVDSGDSEPAIEVLRDYNLMEQIK